MADCNTPEAISDFATKDSTRIVGTIAKALAANSPFLNVLNGGTFEAGVSDTVRSVIQMEANPGNSHTNPAFVADTDIAGTLGLESQVATVDFTYSLKSLRGRGPRVDVKKGFAAFKGSYTMAEDALKKDVTQVLNADIKYQLLNQSASKFVAATGQPFGTLFTGGEPTDIGIGFVDIEPTGQMSFAALHKIVRHARENLLAENFEGGAGGYARVICSSDLLDRFREEAGVKEVLMALTTGSYKLGESVLTAYQWESGAVYRGIQFGVDQRPYRCNTINSDGTVTLINPRVAVDSPTPNKSYSKTNPSWASAALEIGFIVFKDSFERQVPERYIGEGSFKFAPQLHMGELNWHYHIDNDCNPWGDFGFHKYQISRAYKPIRPERVIPFIYKRCEADLALSACEVG